jgi:hypothetical protein
MAAAELRSRPAPRIGGLRLAGGGAAAWVCAYAGIWTVSLLAAGVVAAAGQPATSLTQRVLGLRLSAQRNPPPDLGHILTVAAHNIPIAAWPLLLGLAGADRGRRARLLGDGAVIACILANTVPVGAALGAYGTPLLAYLPQLPLEWAGLALGVSSWLRQRRGSLTARERVRSLAAITGVLLCAALLEVVAIPHR